MGSRTPSTPETFRELGIDIINTDRPEACTFISGALTGRFSLSEE
ncbi:MAG: hypothetical protein ACLUEV_06630 [Alistipes sp.]